MNPKTAAKTTKGRKPKKNEINNRKNKITKIQHFYNSYSFPIVALGASAGGLESYEEFFLNTLPNPGITYMLITHLDPNHISLLPELISRYTKMPVVKMTNNLTIKPGVIYILPPNKNACIAKGKLLLVKQKLPHHTNLPIDFFLTSLAREVGEFAGAVIMSGSGQDGTRGISEIKKYNGLVIIQDAVEAKFNAMPKNAIATGMTDYILPLREISTYISRWFSTKKTTRHSYSGSRESIIAIKIANRS